VWDGLEEGRRSACLLEKRSPFSFSSVFKRRSEPRKPHEDRAHLCIENLYECIKLFRNSF
jgi:hypothetical protein